MVSNRSRRRHFATWIYFPRNRSLLHMLSGRLRQSHMATLSDQIASRCSVNKLSSRLCKAFVELLNHKDIHGVHPELANWPKLKNCYQNKIVNTVCSKFEDSIELVISESTKFFEDLLFEVSLCIVCAKFYQNKENPYTCQYHRKFVREFEEKSNGEISKSFEGQLFFRSWVNENRIKLKDQESHQYPRMQFLFSTLLLMFKSLTQVVVSCLIHTVLKSCFKEGDKWMESQFLSHFGLNLNLKVVIYLHLKDILTYWPELLKRKVKMSNLEDMGQSSLVTQFQDLLAELHNYPCGGSMLKENVSSVVHITSSKGSGSGFVWDRNGHIVTNYHVTGGDRKLGVTFHDNSTSQGEVIGDDKDKDIAVLRVNEEKVRRPLRPGDPSRLQLDDTVYAIGNPFGKYPGSCTRGIISSLGKDIWQKSTIWPIPDAIQTDAAINPGNSGGPLLNSEGKLIGMNTAIGTTSDKTTCGVAFAISVDTLLHIVPQLLSKDHKVERPFLGIWCNPKLYQEVKVDGTIKKGVPFTDAPKEGPAGRKGLVPTSFNLDGTLVKLGDIIRYVKRETYEDQEEVTTGLDLFRILDKCKIDEQVTLVIFRSHSKKRKRGGSQKMMNICVKLESRSEVEKKACRVFGSNYI